MHELTGKICKKRFGSIAGSPAVYSEEVDQITTDWLKQKAEEISTCGSINITWVEYTLGLKEKSLENKIQEYFVTRWKAKGDEPGITANEVAQIAKEHYEKENE